MSFLVDREITIVYLVCCETFQIALIIILKKRKILIQETGVFLFKHFPKEALYDFALFIIALIVGYFVDKKKKSVASFSKCERMVSLI